MTDRRTIILLCTKRSGSTALFHMFQKHPECSVCHVDQSIEGCEASFWHFAARSIAGEQDEFSRRFGQSHPFLGGRAPRTPADAFAMWDEILDRTGPVVFDKTPKTLGHPPTIALLRRYRDRGNDVRLLATVRDPRDAIASQFTLWAEYTEGDSPQLRERIWVRQYQHLEQVRAEEFIPLFRYEDIAAAPAVYAPTLLQHCGLSPSPELWSHICPVNVGRHLAAPERDELTNWTIGPDMIGFLRRYGYAIGDDAARPSRSRHTAAVSI